MLLLLTLASPRPVLGATSLECGLGIGAASARGHLGDALGEGFEARASAVLWIDSARRLGLRIEGGSSDFGTLLGGVPVPDTLGRGIVTSNRNVSVISAGPELAWSFGPVRPYVFASIGRAFSGADVSISAFDSSGTTLHLDRNVSGSTLAEQVGGGLTGAFTRHFTWDFTVTYQHCRDVVTVEESLTRQPDGTLIIREFRGSADILIAVIGMSYTFPLSGGYDRPHRGAR